MQSCCCALERGGIPAHVRQSIRYGADARNIVQLLDVRAIQQPNCGVFPVSYAIVRIVAFRPET